MWNPVTDLSVAKLTGAATERNPWPWSPGLKAWRGTVRQSDRVGGRQRVRLSDRKTKGQSYRKTDSQTVSQTER